MDLSTMKLADLLAKPLECTCGRTHTVEIKTVEISEGALQKVPGIIRRDGHVRPFIIADCNTYKVAGRQLSAMLKEEQIPHSFYVFDDPELVPDERAIGSILMELDLRADLIIAVGSGTLNDLSRFVSYRLGLPYYVVATAPSVDGYASNIAPLIRKNLKTIYKAHAPKAIIADVDILAQAPQEMIAAGFGDILGKYVALADWKLSAIINDEYYCEIVAAMTRHSLEKTMSLKEGIAKADKTAIRELMEALVLAGIGMSYAGNSRPASGSEHHFSHFWDTLFLLEGRKAVLHGSTVGLGAIVVAKLYQYLREERLEPTAIAKIGPPRAQNWEDEVHRVFSEAAAEVISLEQKERKNDPAAQQGRIQVIAKHWPEIEEVLASVPPSEQLVELLVVVQGVTDPAELGISAQRVSDGVVYAKEVRPRYTILQLLWDLDLLHRYGERVVAED